MAPGRLWRSIASSFRQRIIAKTRCVAAVTQEGHRATIRYATTPIGTTPVAWRADSARVTDTPLIDFVLEVERRASGAQLASTPAFSLDASLAAGSNHGRSAGGALSVRQYAARREDTGATASRVSRAERALFSSGRGRDSSDIDPAIPGYNYDIVAGVDYTIDLSRPIGERIATLEYERTPGRAHRYIHARTQQLSSDGRRRIRHAARRAGRL